MDHQTHDGTTEGRVTSLEIRMAVAESHIKEFRGKLDTISSDIRKLMWLVLAAVVGAVLKSVGLI